jgi:predicted HAD superfamily phosphohydrolase
LQRLVADGTLPNGCATDNDTGLVYKGTELHEVITERDGALAYEVRRDGDEAVETALPIRLL